MYEDYYNLFACPFGPDHNTDFFFSSKQHMQALSYMRFALSKGFGNVVITGERGVGKSLVTKILIESIDTAEIIVGKITANKASDQSIPVQICHEFNVPIRENTSTIKLISVLQHFFEVCSSHNRRVLLIIDDAQNLSLRELEDLQLLSDFNLHGASLAIQIFFIGGPELRAMIMRPDQFAFRSLVIASSHLKPLSLSDVSDYIEHRLSYAGYTRGKLIDMNACHEILQITNGIPGQINRVCSKLLDYGQHEQIRRFDAESVHLALSLSEFEDTSV